MAYPRRELNERLIRDRVHVDASTGCWLWQGSTNNDGIGQIGAGGRVYTAPRAAWIVFVGPIEPKCRIARNCPNAACCNPEHHEHLTPLEHRQRQGLMLTNATLTAYQVQAIRSRVRLGEPQADIARDFDVADSTIAKIRKGESWRHVPEDGA